MWKRFTSFWQLLKRCTQKNIGSFFLLQGVEMTDAIGLLPNVIGIKAFYNNGCFELLHSKMYLFLQEEVNMVLKVQYWMDIVSNL